MSLKDTLLKWKYAVVATIFTIVLYFILFQIVYNQFDNRYTPSEIYFVTLFLIFFFGGMISIFLNKNTTNYNQLKLEILRTGALVTIVFLIFYMSSIWIRISQTDSSEYRTNPVFLLAISLFLIIGLSVFGIISGSFATYSLRKFGEKI